LREFCAEGLAPHGDPEPCVDVPRGRGEASVGARAGRAMEPRNQRVRGADVVDTAEGNTVGGVMRESPVGPARSESQGMYGNSMSENWESPCPPTRLITGRAAQGTRKAEA
jgi:hypothetical protein